MCPNWTHLRGGKMANKFDLKSLLNEKSLKKEDLQENKAKNKTFKVTSLSVYDLIPSEHNFYSTDDIEDLKAAIELFNGVKQNLTVKALQNGKYKVLAGHRRRLASIALVEEGKKEYEFVPCEIEEDVDDIKERLLLIMTNSTSRQLSDFEKMQQASQLKELLTEYKKTEKLQGRTRDLIANILKTSPTQVGRMESISSNLSDNFKKEFKEQKVNMSTVYEISGLPEQSQKEIFQEYKDKGTINMNDVKKIKKQSKQESKKAENEIEKLIKELNNISMRLQSNIDISNVDIARVCIEAAKELEKRL